MSIRKHDKAGEGFDVDPELLAHDLTLLKMSVSGQTTSQSTALEMYDIYTKALGQFLDLVEDKTRYDSSFKE